MSALPGYRRAGWRRFWVFGIGGQGSPRKRDDSRDRSSTSATGSTPWRGFAPGGRRNYGRHGSGFSCCCIVPRLPRSTEISENAVWPARAEHAATGGGAGARGAVEAHGRAGGGGNGRGAITGRGASGLRQAQLRIRADVQDVDCRAGRGIARTTLTQLAAGDWIRQGHNLILGGSTDPGS